MADEKELTQEELYENFGVEVANTLADVSKKLSYELKPADELTMGQLAKWERVYFTNGKPPTGKYNQWSGYITAAISAGFFVKGSAPAAKDVDKLPPNHAALLFRAVDYLIIRAGQVDPNF